MAAKPRKTIVASITNLLRSILPRIVRVCFMLRSPFKLVVVFHSCLQRLASCDGVRLATDMTGAFPKRAPPANVQLGCAYITNRCMHPGITVFLTPCLQLILLATKVATNGGVSTMTSIWFPLLTTTMPYLKVLVVVPTFCSRVTVPAQFAFSV